MPPAMAHDGNPWRIGQSASIVAAPAPPTQHARPASFALYDSRVPTARADFMLRSRQRGARASGWDAPKRIQAAKVTLILGAFLLLMTEDAARMPSPVRAHRG